MKDQEAAAVLLGVSHFTDPAQSLTSRLKTLSTVSVFLSFKREKAKGLFTFAF